MRTAPSLSLFPAWKTPALSKHPDAIVVGGGIAGLAIAHRLAGDGLCVTLLERGSCGREASWAGAGIVAPPNPHRDDPMSHLQQRSVDQYAAWASAIHEQSGIDPEYEQCGELQLAFTASEWGILRSQERVGVELQTNDGLPAFQVHAPSEISHVEPIVAKGVLGGLESRCTAQVRNPRLLRALELACRRSDVDVRENAFVRDLVMEGGRVSGVALEQEKLHGGCTILCAGAWSSAIGTRLKKLMPVHPVLGQMILLKLKERRFQRILSYGKQYLVPRRDGHILLGATEEPGAAFRKRNTPAGIGMLTERALQLAPGLADAAVVASWSGLRPGTPDGLPYMGAVPGMDGLWAATGHLRAGLTLAPAIADVLAAMVQGAPLDVDLSCCKPGRVTA